MENKFYLQVDGSNLVIGIATIHVGSGDVAEGFVEIDKSQYKMENIGKYYVDGAFLESQP